MILSMAAFAGEDSVIKALSNELPVSQILFVIGIGGAIVFATIGLLLKREILVPEINSLPISCSDCYRNLWPNILFPCSLFNLFSSTTMILQATPLVVVLGASFSLMKKWVC